MTVSVATSAEFAPTLQALGFDVRGADAADVLVLDAAHVGADLPLRLLFALPLDAEPSLECADGCVPAVADAATLRGAIERVGSRVARARRLGEVAASIADATYEADLPDGAVTWAGDLERIAGEPASAFAADVPSFFRRLMPEDRQLLLDALERAQHGDVRFDLSYRIRHADGRWRVWRDRGRFLIDHDGGVRAVGGVTDVTAESSAQARFVALNERLRVAAASLGFGIYEFDFRGGRAWFSPEGRAMFGTSEGEEIPVDARGIPTAVLPEDRGLAERALNAALDPVGGGEMSCEYRIRRPDGTMRWVQAQAQLFFDDADASRTPTWATGVLFDVTDRREAEVRLRGRDSRLRHIMRTSPVGIVFARLTGEILDCNDAFLRMVGYGPGEPAATALHWGTLTVRDDEAHDVVQEMATTGAIAPIEIPLRRRDGSVATVLATGVRFDPHLDEQVAFVFDLTPMKQSEERLRASERQFRLVLEHAPIPIFLHTPDGEIVARSRAVEAISGWTAADTPTGAEWYRRARRLDDATIAAELGRVHAALERGEPVQEEVDIWTKDGRRLRWLYRGSTLLDAESGRPLLTSMALDVTAQREAADELTSVADDLRQSNALLDAIFASAPVGLSFWDRDLRFRRVNPRLAEMNGLPESAHVGRRPDELMPGIADLEGILRLWREVIDERRTHTIEVRGTTPASPEDVRVWREHFFPVEIDGEVVGGSAVVEDVTARRLAEERLAAEEQRYRRIFEQTTTSTWELDLSDVRTALARLRADGVDELAAHFEAQPAALRTLLPLLHVRSVNPATLRLVGARSKEELASRLPLLLTDETWRSIGATFADLAEGRAEVRRETTLRTVDGREIHVLARARLPGPDERADQVLVSLLDVTALKDAEAVLREANQRKDEFLAMLAHELRNPLAPIRNAAEALRLARSEEPVVRWARDLIERQVQHLAHIVDDLLDVSRIVQGKVVLHRAPLDLRAVVRSAVETNRSAIDARGHALVLELPDMPLPVEGDFVRLTQVVGNLLTNAAKYTPEGGRITVTARADGGQVLLRVKDTGEGIARELLPQVFDLFTQAHRTIDRSQGGLGIGLTVVKRLVDMHGGEITAASEGPGRGAEFTMRLPRAASLPVVPADPPLPPPSSRASGPVRVLVVDDNVDAAESLAELLRLSGYAVKTAPDGGAALGVVESFRPEVALLDLGLPGMDGFELARRLRERPVTQGALLVAVTGYGREEDVRLAHDAGFDHHLVKPVDLPALRELLATAG